MVTSGRATSRSGRTGSPRTPRRYSPTRSAPAARDSGSPPENRGLTSVKAISPASPTKPCTLAGPVSPTALSSWATAATSARLSNVRPLVLIPALVSSRQRGTAPASPPSRSTSASTVNSRPCQPRLHQRLLHPGQREGDVAGCVDRVDVAGAAAEPGLDDPRPRHAGDRTQGGRRDRHPGGAAGLGEGPLVGAGAHRGHARQPAAQPGLGQQPDPVGQGLDLLGHRADQRGGAVPAGQLGHVGGEVRAVAARHHPGPAGQPQPDRVRVAVDGQHVVPPAQGPDHRDPGRAAGPGDEHPPLVCVVHGRPIAR